MPQQKEFETEYADGLRLVRLSESIKKGRINNDTAFFRRLVGEDRIGGRARYQAS